MSCEFFTKANFRGKTLETIEQANEILGEYRANGFTLTLRQLYYQFVARQLIPNDAREYARLGRTMVDARRSGLVDWGAIEDRTRNLETFSSWENPAEILHTVARDYQENPWADQKYQPYVFVEKPVRARYDSGASRRLGHLCAVPGARRPSGIEP